MSGRPRARQLAATPVARYAVLVFLLAAALIVAVAVTLDRNARRSSWQEHTTALAGGARVGASSFESLRANLRVQATQLATSLPLQRAVVTGNEADLRRIADTRHARIDLRGRSIGALAGAPRISSTAKITDGVRVLATVTIGLPLGDEVLTLLRQATPLPRHGGLLLVRNGRVIAGGPAGAAVQIRGGRVDLRGTSFAAQSAPLRAAGTSLVAVEPVSAIDALSERYRRFVFLAAAVTLALAAALANRLARPLAQVVGDVARLTRQAHTDALTGLANRRELTARLEDELQRAARNGTSLSFVIADIDDFKPINDGFGHQMGDEVIKAVASVLAASVRETDLPVRFGGEEFVIVLPGARLAHARRAADTMRTAIAELEIPGAPGRADPRHRQLRRGRVPDVRNARGTAGGRRRRSLSGEAGGQEPRGDVDSARRRPGRRARRRRPAGTRPLAPLWRGRPASSLSWRCSQSAALRKAAATISRARR